ncbi:MAG TPA: histidinol dehydrogenase [Candidatus Nanopelagicaceae bacterium]|nr:histidinol dehydrogenase [Candidatus Nanopelagicaceae bacterium]
MITALDLPAPSSRAYRDALDRPPQKQGLRQETALLLEQVRLGGDAAVRALTLRFDGVDVARTRVGLERIRLAAEQADPGLVGALRAAAANIARFHQAQGFAEEAVEVRPGVRGWREWRPLERVGVYVPGGRAPYPSSVLMLCVPARLAGCREVVLCSPPGPGGEVSSNILAAAFVAGVTEVHAIGGVQAIAAMTYGTESVARVDKLFGPGNAHVTAAKRLVFGDVGVDMPAGPSEVVVITDGSVPAAWLAADLEAQAEHAPDAVGVLVATDPAVAGEVARLIEPDRVAQVRIFVSPDLEQAIRFANDYAPEHLILACRDPAPWLPLVRNAGSVFLGAHAPAALGDYATGANHVLPTGGMARSFSPLGLLDFGHTLQVQSVSPAGLAELAPVVEQISRVEGFRQHWRSVEVRLGSDASTVDWAPEPRRSVREAGAYEWEISNAQVAARHGLLPQQVVRFDTNTCPWELVTADGPRLEAVNEYPDSAYPELTAALAHYAGVPAESITVGAGADELLALIAETYIGPLDPVVVPDPSYAMFTVLSGVKGARLITVPAGDPARLLGAAAEARLVWICNPNNPTGDLIRAEVVAEAARVCPGVVVVDEAYFEFSGASSVGMAQQLTNLVVVRTMSKAFGLAGARVGYAVSSPQIASWLARVRPPASVSSLSAALAVQALQMAPDMRRRVAELNRWKADLSRAITEVGLQVRPTAANFLLVACPPGLGPALEQIGVVVRQFPKDSLLADWMRVTVRSPADNARLMHGLQAWMAARVA